MDAAPSQNKDQIANPYIVGRPLTGSSAHLYVGRNDVFTWFQENLTGTTRPNALLLYGSRRIGKTSTLFQLVEGQRGRVVRENRERSMFAAYIDLQRLVGRPTDEWLRRLARDIYRRVHTSILSRTIPDSAVAGETAYAAFDRCLDRLEEILPADSLILLAIDELEQVRVGIEDGTLSPYIMPYLRSQIQHRDRFAFLLCGTRGLLEPFWSPIVDLTARYELGPLDVEQTAFLITEPLAGIGFYEDEAVDAIWRRTAGHPYLVQAVCHRLVSLLNSRHSRGLINLADVKQAIDQLKREDLSRTWWNSAPARKTRSVSSSMKVAGV